MSITLTLNNFKRYDTKTIFTFPRNGLVLLQGVSGIGKTTILDAIYFVLYGCGTKIINFNATNCSVTWDDGVINITRSKKPNRLVLIEDGIVYEDIVAQEIIDRKYGTSFEITSYIKYKAASSFFSLGPSSRMEFLQKIAIKGTDVNMLKTKTKEAIKMRKDKLLKISSEMKVVESEFNNLDKPEVVKFPLGKYNELKVKNNQVKMKNNNIKLKNARKCHGQLLIQSNSYKLQRQQNKFNEDKVKEYNNEMDILNMELSLIQYHDLSFLQDVYKILETNKKYNDILKDIETIEISLQELITEEDCIRNKEIKRLQDIPLIEDLTQVYKQKWDLKENILHKRQKKDEYKDNLEDYNYIDHEYIEGLKKQLQILSHGVKKYSCPACNCSLVIKNEILVLQGEIRVQTDSEISTSYLTSQISDSEKKLKEKNRLESLIEQHQAFLQENDQFDVSYPYETLYRDNYEAIRQQEQNQKELNRLQNSKYSIGILKLQKELYTKRALLDTLKNVPNTSQYTDIDEVKSLLLRLMAENDKYKSIQKRVEQIKNLIVTTQDKIINIEDIEYDTLIENIDKEIKCLEMEEISLRKINNELDAYKQYIERQHYYDKWKTKWENLKVSENNGIKSLQVAEEFLTLINVTESKAVTNVINSLNLHLKYYAEHFFSEPMAIQILSFKESGNGNVKPSINIKVSYKGMEYDVDCLSGGETSRVELSVCLAINNIMGGKILLLDEVLGTLNSGYIDTITGVLKDEALRSDKLILTILHGATEGNFDQVISVE